MKAKIVTKAQFVQAMENLGFCQMGISMFRAMPGHLDQIIRAYAASNGHTDEGYLRLRDLRFVRTVMYGADVCKNRKIIRRAFKQAGVEL